MSIYSNVTLDGEGVLIDGHRLDKGSTGTDITVDSYGDDFKKITLSIYTRSVTIADDVPSAARVTVHRETTNSAITPVAEV